MEDKDESKDKSKDKPEEAVGQVYLLTETYPDGRTLSFRIRKGSEFSKIARKLFLKYMGVDIENQSNEKK
jgi:hypothetical protein